MPMRDGGTQPLATRRPAVSARHLGRGPSFINEDQAIRVQIGLVLKPLPTLCQDVRALLLCGVASLFLRVMRWRAKKRRQVP